MHCQVYVANLDGSGEIDLSDGDDTEAAANLVYGLVSAASGKGFVAGIRLTPSAGGEGGTAAPSAAQRQTAQPSKPNR